MRRALLLWLSVEVAVLAWIAASASRLPGRVAVHFDASGAANGWMSRAAHLGLFATVSVLLPGLVFAAFTLARWGAPRRLNVPHPEYWRSPEHFAEACAILRVVGAVLATGVCLWLGIMQETIVRANEHTPPMLPAATAHLLSGGLVAFSVGCVLALWLRFRRIPGSE